MAFSILIQKIGGRANRRWNKTDGQQDSNRWSTETEGERERDGKAPREGNKSLRKLKRAWHGQSKKKMEEAWVTDIPYGNKTAKEGTSTEKKKGQEKGKDKGER